MAMAQYMVDYIKTGVAVAEQRQVGAFSESDAIKRIRDEYGFNKVTIKGCKKA